MDEYDSNLRLKYRICNACKIGVCGLHRAGRIYEQPSYSTIGGPHEATGAIGEGGARTPRQQRVQEGDAQS
jgi:hypothetical protein